LRRFVAKSHTVNSFKEMPIEVASIPRLFKLRQRLPTIIQMLHIQTSPLVCFFGLPYPTVKSPFPVALYYRKVLPKRKGS
jgi:hypothetical protein